MNFLHFMIRSKRKGFYLIDNGGKNGVKVRVTDNPIQLFKDFICKIGDHIFRISSIQAPTPRRDDTIVALSYKHYPPVPEGDPCITFEFISEEMKGVVIKFEGDKKRILIGSNKESDVLLSNTDGLHASIELRSVGWTLIDQHSSTGSFIFVNTWDRYSLGAPSRQLLLYNLMHLSLPGTEFQVFIKAEPDDVFSISKNPMIRLDRFRRLYRIGKYVKPGNDFKEFECTHKFTRDKCLVTVVDSRIFTTEVQEKIKNIRSINSENIHKVLEIIEDGPFLYIVNEFLHGNDLQEIISLRSTMSEEQAGLLFKNMIITLKLLHDNNIVFGNIRPDYFVSTSGSRDDGILKITGVLRGAFKQDTQELEYESPEGLKGNKSFASDIWSSGVILYTLLTGSSPFKGTNPDETKAYINRASPSFKQNQWEGISPYAKILLKTIFFKDPKLRPSCFEILSDIWLNGKVKFLDLTAPISSKAFKDLKSHYCFKKLHQGLFVFIQKIIASNQDRDQALSIFKELDAENTSKLSRTEILGAFEYLHIELTEGELESIIREVDANMTGTLDYFEFLAAVSNKRKNFAVEKLESVFRSFDNDGSGTVTASEIKKLVGEGNLAELVSRIESNEDGKIDIKDLKNLVLTMLPSL